MQTSKVGGSSVTLHMAVAVKPPFPAGPFVVITLTGAQTRAMAFRNSILETASSIVSTSALQRRQPGIAGPAVLVIIIHALVDERFHFAQATRALSTL